MTEEIKLRSAEEWIKEHNQWRMDFTKRIQLNAIQFGMQEAAKMVGAQPIYSDFSLSHREGARCMAEKIITAAKEVKL